MGGSNGLENSKKLVYLLQEIEGLREELNKRVSEDLKMVNNVETLNLSQKLDKLIARYLKNKDR